MGPKLIDILNINILPPTLMRNSDYQIRYRWVSPILSFWGQKRDFIGLLFFIFVIAYSHAHAKIERKS